MELGVDERAQLCGCLDGRVQVQAELGEHGELWAKPGGRHQHIDTRFSFPVRGHRVNSQRVLAGEVGDGERGEDFDASGVDQRAQSGAECPACCEFVLLSAAVDASEVCGADGPDDRGGIVQSCEVQQAAEWPAPVTMTRLPATRSRSRPCTLGSPLTDPRRNVASECPGHRGGTVRLCTFPQ